jgi:hypothetical protein
LIATPFLAIASIGFLGACILPGDVITASAAKVALSSGGVANRGLMPSGVGAESRVNPSEPPKVDAKLWPAVPGTSSPSTATLSPPTSSAGGAITATSTNVGSAYTALVPYRLVDTRTGSGFTGAGDILSPGTTLTFTVTGIDTVPTSATAVALNVTVTDTTAASYLSVYPTGDAQPLVANLNWTAGETVPNAVIAPVGTDGQVTIFNALGDTDVVVDLEGYFVAETGGSTAGSYVPLTPARIADTRSGSGYPNAGDTPGPGGTLTVQVTGAGGVPVSNVAAALLNVTVTNTTSASYLTAYPQGAAQPLAANLNWVSAETVGNRVIVKVSSSGQFTVYNAIGSTDVVVDVSGYFTEGATPPANAGLYTPVSPGRAIDTRPGSGEPLEGSTLGPGGEVSDKLSQIGSLGSNVTAVVSNVTATDATAASFFTVYPGGTRPLAADVNWGSGDTVANLTVASVGADGNVSFYNGLGDVDLVVDVFGYFSSTATLGEQGYGSSPNWSGYVEGNGPQSSVTGTFAVPNLNTPLVEGSIMSEWVGIDGDSNSDLIQAGIQEYAAPSDPPGYYTLSAWWEILPAPETVITSLTNLTPGDSITVTISKVSGTTWSITMDDSTEGQSFSTDQTYTGPAASAEWIVEASEIDGTEATLAAYSPTGFTGVSADGPDSTEVAVYMVQNDAIVSVPSAPGESGTSFNVDYGDSIPAPP